MLLAQKRDHTQVGTANMRTNNMSAFTFWFLTQMYARLGGCG